jgi:polyprenyl-phospho-N-acetylgalactosaminyl synthase
MPVGILMPCYNEGERVLTTLRALAGWAEQHEPVTVYLVDDGGTVALAAHLASPLASLAANLCIVHARHVVNLGQGAALETARRLALRAPTGRHDVLVTMDADGQHDPADLCALIAAVRAGADLAQGERSQSVGIPWRRRLLLACARAFESMLVGRWVKDAHNGYRAIAASALSKFELHQNRMAHATELTIRARAHELRCVDVAVHLRYSEETLAKGQRALDAVFVLRDLAGRYLFARGEGA